MVLLALLYHLILSLRIPKNTNNFFHKVEKVYILADLTQSQTQSIGLCISHISVQEILLVADKYLYWLLPIKVGTTEASHLSSWKLTALKS